MRVGALLLLLVSLGFAAPAAAQTSWQDYKSFEGGFAALFPGKPEVAEKALAEGATYHSVVVDLNDTAFLVIYTSYKPGTFAGKDSQLVLDQVRDKLVAGQKVAVRADRPFTFASQAGASYAGRELVIDDANGSTQVYHVYVVKDRLYQVICGGPKGFDRTGDAQRFQDSFQLLGQ